ncbi:MAG TPA: aminotransferase class V-fold PLP-dependent enzyme [Devosiaceae bacterium]|jgi:aspartate aminotransferase-like enzyme
MPSFSPLLNPPAFPASGYAPLADRLRRLLSTAGDVIFVQAEAILALEAAAASLARPGMTAVNIVTSPYGGYFGSWLRRGGATVHEIVAEAGRPITVTMVKAALDDLPTVDLVAIVHAETSSGILNPLPEVAALAEARGALLVVDGVASVGGHALDVDALGIDVAVIGPQKALGGPAALSIAAISPRAWAEMAKAPKFSPSILSLTDIKEVWLDRGRGALPGMPSALDFWALEAALDRVEAEGLAALIAQHELAGRASRAGLLALGVEPWIIAEAEASTLVTAAPVPAGIDPDGLITATARYGVTLSPGFGAVRDRLVRLDHTGIRANFGTVITNLAAYGSALRDLGVTVNIGAAVDAAAAAFS